MVRNKLNTNLKASPGVPSVLPLHKKSCVRVYYCKYVSICSVVERTGVKHVGIVLNFRVYSVPCTAQAEAAGIIIRLPIHEA